MAEMSTNDCIEINWYNRGQPYTVATLTVEPEVLAAIVKLDLSCR